MVLDQGLALHLNIFMPLAGISRPIGQALEVCLGHFLDLARVHKFSLKKGDLLRCLICLLMN
jgi:hypothetical protein